MNRRALLTTACGVAALTQGSAAAAEASVKVHLLEVPPFQPFKAEAKEQERKTAQDKRPKFWIDWVNDWRPIDQSAIVTGEKAIALILLLRRTLLEKEAGDFCGHHPIYGIEAIRPDGSKFTTSVCFDCGTWVQPKKRYHMNQTGIQCELALALRAIVELPQSVLDADAARRAKAAAAERKLNEKRQGSKPSPQ